jgi:hypothetical protein
MTVIDSAANAEVKSTRLCRSMVLAEVGDLNRRRIWRAGHVHPPVVKRYGIKQLAQRANDGQ